MSRRSARRALALLLLPLTLLLGAALLLAGPASAHATVVTSTPADGSRLKTVPKSVTITFDESVGLGDIGYLHVTDGSGKRVDAGAAFHPGGDGTKVTDTLTTGLGDSTYTASYRVISADSHPVAGTVVFVVGNGPLVRSGGSTSTTDGFTGAFFDGVRWLSYLGFALLGGGWIVLFLWPEGRDEARARRIVWTGWGAAALGAVLELLLQGAYAAGDSLAKIVSPNLVDDTLHTTYGELHSVRLVLLGLIAVLLARSLRDNVEPSRREADLAVLFVGAAATFSAGGHAATTSPTWLSVAADMLHLLTMAAWIGGLVIIGVALLPRRDVVELRRVVPVFSTVALGSVVLLVASGTYSAWRGIGAWDAIFGTTYGLLIVSKVVFLAAILAVAQLSRRSTWRLAGRKQRQVAYAMADTAEIGSSFAQGSGKTAPDSAGEGEDPEITVERLRRSVLVEAAAAVIVLVLSAVLVNEPRGREALAASYRTPVSAVAPLGGGKGAEVTVDPGVHGTVTVRVELTGGASASSVQATATQKQAQIGPLPVTLSRESGDTFDGSVALPVAGSWEFDLTITSGEFDAVTTNVSLGLH